MKVVQKTSSKIVLEVSKTEIDENGFDGTWDKIRDWYSTDKFDIFSITEDGNKEGTFFIELKIVKKED